MNYKNTFKIKLLSFFLFYLNTVKSQNFDKVTSTIDLKGAYIGLATFVDYNNDGLLDIFETGLDFGNNGDFKNAILYKNNGDETFTESSIKNIPRNVYSSCSWGDFNNDGTLDLIYCGTLGGPEYNMTKVYKNINNGCEFIEIQTSIPKISSGTVEWVDVNNDGFLDVFYQGTDINGDYDSGIYKNNGNETFTKIENTSFYIINGTRANAQYNSAKWADFDGDGLKDILTASSTKTEREFAIYKNLGNFKFEKINFNLPQLSYISMDVGDINKDGLIDFVFTGSTKYDLMSGDPGTKLYFYINKGNMNFNNSFTMNNDGAFLSKIKLGDFNNDGFTDLINYGSGLSFRKTKFYLNNKNDTFTEINKSFPDCYSGGIDFGDYDNDKDLDILYYGRIENPRDDEVTYVYENKTLNIELPTEILFDKGCDCNLQGDFSLNNSVDNVKWDFNDPTTGTSNESVSLRPKHTFSKRGTYIISATYTKGTKTETLNKTISIFGLPEVTQPADVSTCNVNEEFNFHTIKDSEILKDLSPLDYEINYYLSQTDADNNINKLSDIYKIQKVKETIYVRIQNKEKSNCYVVKKFEINVLASPIANAIDDIYVCDSDNDGFSLFNLSNVENIIIENQINVKVDYYDSKNNLLTTPLSNNYKNTIKDKDYIIAKITNTATNCFIETKINLIASPLPIANNLDILVGCDDNNDGVSEYFDTSLVEKNVLAGQMDMKVSYYDNLGNEIIYPLANPFTNTTIGSQNIIIRVTNLKTNCSSETILVLKTSSKPIISKPKTIFACEEEKGFGNFNTETIESQLIGNQSGLKVLYKDVNGVILPSPLPKYFKNTIADHQTIFVRVENSLNPLCFSETSFDLTVNKLPVINLQNKYVICGLDSHLFISVDSNFDSYQWKFEDGTIISTSNEAKLIKDGNYNLIISKSENGIMCENNFPFSLTRSKLPTIENVVYDEFGSNSVEIEASGDGVFEYSIDGINYQDSNIFNTISGGDYVVHVKDKGGCGQDNEEITLLNYPKFVTPNDDGYNDFWQIKGIDKYPKAKIYIYDRYGKLLKQLDPKEIGWDGKYNQQNLISDDYWFTVNLGNQNRTFKGHFSLKR
nr:FG-GAP-like repeat-containing protein [uncultured Flavobacterium sp.]